MDEPHYLSIFGTYIWESVAQNDTFTSHTVVYKTQLSHAKLVYDLYVIVLHSI